MYKCLYEEIFLYFVDLKKFDLEGWLSGRIFRYTAFVLCGCFHGVGLLLWGESKLLPSRTWGDNCVCIWDGVTNKAIYMRHETYINIKTDSIPRIVTLATYSYLRMSQPHTFLF